MRQRNLIKFFGLLLVVFIFSIGGFAQKNNSRPADITVVSEEDLMPSVMKSLPNWDNVRNSADHIRNAEELKKAFGEREVFNLIDFTGGTEAAGAKYDAGHLLVVEYNTPQAAFDSNAQIEQRLKETPPNPPVYYRRIGNYSVFVFDANSEAAAGALLDQVKYDKTVRWLGQNPNILKRAEQAYVRTASDIFLSTAITIVLGISSTILLGIGIGFAFFYFRKQKRSEMTAFSDAGGMIRLNLDELSEAIPDRLLNE